MTFTVYNDQNHTVFTSVPFVVAARTTWLDPNGATDITGTTPGGTITTFDALGRSLIATDPLGNQTRTIYGIGSANGDSNVYATISIVDANQHVMMSYADLLGRPRYSFSFNGIYGGTLTSTLQITAQYNALNKPTSVTVTDLVPQSGQSVTTVTTTSQYDDLGRQTVLTDPDRGTHTFTYNANGAVIKDVSGARTLGVNYDLLGRSICVQDAQPTPDPHGSCTSGANSFVKNTYDANPSGVTWTNVPIGRLTQAVATTTYPDGTQGIVTEQMQYDQRGQLITNRMSIGGDAFPTLPFYQQQLSYNNANQLTTTQTTVDGQPGYTFTQAYNNTTGVPIGLSNTSTGTPGLIELTYNERALISDVIFKDTTGATLATKHQLYDGNLRLASSSTTWQSGGTVYSDGISFDPVGNVISRVTTHAAVEGISGSGGNETQNFCYDAQNRLTWASNSTSASPASGEHCGTATLQNQLGASYLNRYVYTQLGQLWQGPLGGTGAQQQYLYCNSGQPHQLTHMSPLSDNPVCGTPGTTAYTASYDAWGNMIARTYQGQIGTLTFDTLDHLTQWKAFANSKQEQYLYNAAGERVMRRSNDGLTTKLTVYAFGLEEHQYEEGGSSLSNTGNTFYFVIGKSMVGMLTGTTTLSTSFLLTDMLGSVISRFSNIAGSAQVLGNQLYGPYGNQRYKQGNVGTDKGYTGQYGDSLTGLGYYVARYYDPLIGRFISADTVESNLKGMDPYAYVGGNPETKNDPTGKAAVLGILGAMLAGAFAGALGGALGNILAQIVIGYMEGYENPWDIDWGEVGWAAVFGAIEGATFLLGKTLVHSLKASLFTRTLNAVSSEISAATNASTRLTASAIHKWVTKVGAQTMKADQAGMLGNLARDEGRIYLGSFGGDRVVINGVEVRASLAGVNTLRDWANGHGGRVLDIVGAKFPDIKPFIDNASSIVFNISRSGFWGNSFTGEEFRYIMSHPHLLRKVIFVFDATR